MTDVKLIAIDMDGTLLSTQKTISEENKKALQFWSSKGVPIVLASGRMTPALDAISIELGVDCILMGYNGAECLSAKKEARKRIFHNPLPTGSINEIIQFCQSNNHFLNVYHEGKLYGESDKNKIHYPNGYAYLNQAKYEFIESYDYFLNKHPTKALIIKENQDEIHIIYDQLKDLDFVTKFNMIKTCSHNDSYRQEYLEFLHPEVNKATGLGGLCSVLGIDQSEVVAFGDGENDLEMLRFAGTGICMAQGTESAKRAASSHVSKWSNDESAVAKELMLLADRYF